MMTQVLLVPPGSGTAALSYSPIPTGGNSSLGGLVSSCACAALIAIAGVTQTTTGSAGIEIDQPTTPTSVASSWIVDRKRGASSARTTSVAIDLRQSEAIAAQLILLRRRFSLSMQHLAEILGVTRPVLYRWQNGAATPRTKSRERLTALADLAKHFERAGGESVGFALHVANDGQPSLFALLKRDGLPTPFLKLALAQLAERDSGSNQFVSIEQVLLQHGIMPGAGRVDTADREDVQIGARNERNRGA